MIIELEVRDYECDVQGIVNNAIYLNYLEHARHKFLLAKNINFIELTKENKNLVIVEAFYKYHKALKPDDKFKIETKMTSLSKIKLCFNQKILLDQELVLEAQVIGVCTDFRNKKIFKIEDIFKL